MTGSVCRRRCRQPIADIPSVGSLCEAERLKHVPKAALLLMQRKQCPHYCQLLLRRVRRSVCRVTILTIRIRPLCRIHSLVECLTVVHYCLFLQYTQNIGFGFYLQVWMVSPYGVVDYSYAHVGRAMIFSVNLVESYLIEMPSARYLVQMQQRVVWHISIHAHYLHGCCFFNSLHTRHTAQHGKDRVIFLLVVYSVKINLIAALKCSAYMQAQCFSVKSCSLYLLLCKILEESLAFNYSGIDVVVFCIPQR